MHLIPAIDLMQGQLVRLTEGKFDTQKAYGHDPVKVARQFEDHGFRFLHLVDLEGAKEGKVHNLPVLEKICKETNLEVDFGGGIQGEDDLKAVLDAGAARVNIGSLAVQETDTFSKWLTDYGADRFILSADVRDMNVAIHGWQTQTPLRVEGLLARWRAQGLNRATVTDIALDGKLTGTAIDLYRTILKTYPDLELIASGGISFLEELDELQEAGLYGAIIGKAIYEKRFSLSDLQSWMKDNAD